MFLALIEMRYMGVMFVVFLVHEFWLALRVVWHVNLQGAPTSSSLQFVAGEGQFTEQKLLFSRCKR